MGSAPIPAGRSTEEEESRLSRICARALRAVCEPGRYGRIAGATAMTWVRYRAVSSAQRVLTAPVDVLFYPEQPRQLSYAMWKICAELGVRAVGEPSRQTALAVLWKDATLIAPAEAVPPAACERMRVLNAGCLDVSKRNVARRFAAVFGYGYDVDPARHRGPCVEKSDQNARHDGRVVFGPIPAPRAGAVYQRLLNNVVAGDLVEDIRAPVIDGIVPFVYLKYRPAGARFCSRNAFVRLCETDAALCADEVRRIAEFARAIGLDYGELDVIRDRDDGRIYVVDANRTPFGPSYLLAGADFRRAVKSIALLFRQRFLASPETLGPKHGCHPVA